MEDREIVDLYLARDEQAIRETDLKYGKYCNTIAYNVLNNSSDAEECVNETWLKAWQSIPPQIPVYLSGFLAKITRNIALNKWNYENAQKREAAKTMAFDELEAVVGTVNGPEEELDATLLSADINRFVKQLSKKDASIFLLRYFFAEEIDVIAKKHHTTKNNVSAILMRTRKKLKSYLEEKGYSV